MKKSIWLISSLCAALLGTASRAAVTYQNPVIPGDYPDPSLIRVGDDYYATATTSEWAPLFPILHSRDLVNWTNLGSVFHKRPDWAVGNFWAPELQEFHGKYFVYYVGRKRNGPLSVAVATADRATGPYTDHGPMISQDAGSIDPVAVEDENGKRFLIWKEDGNSRNQPCPLWIQELSPDGTKLVGEMKEILRNEPDTWEGRVIEGPYVVRHGGFYYLFYSGNACCGRGCHYGLGVARAKTLLGPWEKNPKNPIIAENALWRCPGHGSIVQDPKGDFYLMYHAYHARDFVFVGRQAVLDKVDFADGWPVVNGGRGAAFEAAAPLGKPTTHPQFQFADEFNGDQLDPEWHWPQNKEPVASLAKDHRGVLVLKPNAAFGSDWLAGILAVKTVSSFYTAETEIAREGWKRSTFAGLSAYGDHDNALGLALGENGWELWRRTQKKQETLVKGDLPGAERVFVRLVCREGHKFTFSISTDGQNWKEVAPEAPLEGNYLPPWDRGVRVALTVGGSEDASATFRSMRVRSEPPPLRP